MSKAGGGRPMSWIRALHLIFSFALAFYFGWWAWMHHPVRAVWLKAVAAAPRHGSGLSAHLGAGFGERLHLVWPYLWPDLALGGFAVLLFIVGTGVYAKRLEIWLEAHGSGQLAELRGIGLESQTVEANKGRRGGVMQ